MNGSIAQGMKLRLSHGLCFYARHQEAIDLGLVLETRTIHCRAAGPTGISQTLYVHEHHDQPQKIYDEFQVLLRKEASSRTSSRPRR